MDLPVFCSLDIIVPNIFVKICKKEIWGLTVKARNKINKIRGRKIATSRMAWYVSARFHGGRKVRLMRKRGEIDFMMGRSQWEGWEAHHSIDFLHKQIWLCHLIEWEFNFDGSLQESLPQLIIMTSSDILDLFLCGFFLISDIWIRSIAIAV